ncbi:MAG: dihydrofolate reductase family protein [Chromatiales bacterium]
MPEVIYYVAASLDAYIATPEGGVEWLSPYESPGDDYGYAAFYQSVDAVVMGSRTYEKSLALGEWPCPGKPTWVFTRRSLRAAEASVTLTAATPVQLMSELDAQGLLRVWLVGGGALASSFRAHGLITEYIVSVIPVILGAGIPLFTPPTRRESLTLVESQRYPNGLMQLRYRGVVRI